MSLSICSLASGSSGNCYMIRTDNTILLSDAGISGKQIRLRLEGLGIDMDQISAVLITHEHSDHIKGLSSFIKINKPIYGSEGTLRACKLDSDECLNYIKVGESFTIGDIEIKSFHTSHDAADPTGYCFKADGKCIAIVTDTGYASEEIKTHMAMADILVLESNHDENVLKMGPYPWFLKQRILSEKGHLSNECASQAMAEIISSENSEKTRLILLAHLSKENNFPEMAKATMENILQEKGVLPKAYRLRVLSRNEVSEIYE